MLALPLQLARVLITSFIYVLSAFAKRQIAVMIDNLHFAGINIKPISVLSHFAETILDLARSMRLIRRATFQKYFSFENEAVLGKAVNSNNGVILVSGHLGNWEMGVAALALAGYSVNLVAFKQINPYLDGLINHYRVKYGVKVMYSKGAISRCVEVLNKHEIVVMLIDQTGRDDGVMVDFFGRTVPAMWGPANLALKTASPIIPFACVKSKPNEMRYLITFLPEVQCQRTGDKDRDIQLITQFYIKNLEFLIRKYPEQWIWFHRRWKQYIPAENKQNS